MIGEMFVAISGAGAAVLGSRVGQSSVQFSGLALVGASLIALASPARADQTVQVSDNARVECVASQTDLTRISLVGDEFASVSKVQPSNPLDDFAVVNEPTRGDIYLSVPEGSRLKALSFFGTSKRGFVYKFACQVQAVEAQQIFLSNPDALAMANPVEANDEDEEAPDTDETAVRLIQTMVSQKVVPGYRLERPALVPVKVGQLIVQQVAQYAGQDLAGHVIRVENASEQVLTLAESDVAPVDALAVAISSPTLGPRQATTVYVVVPKRRPVR